MSNDIKNVRWVKSQRQLIKDLVGVHIEKIYWVEMALADQGKTDTPLFRHAELPFVQAFFIRLQVADGRIGQFGVYQNDSNFGLCFGFVDMAMDNNDWPAPDADGTPSIYRKVTDIEFPTGTIKSASSRLDDEGDITEIDLSIEDRLVLLKAGEVYEGNDRTLFVRDCDESILVFFDDNISYAQELVGQEFKI